MPALNKLKDDSLYRMEGSNAWVFANDADIWIIKGESGLSITVWNRDVSMDPVDAIHITWDKIERTKS